MRQLLVVLLLGSSLMVLVDGNGKYTFFQFCVSDLGLAVSVTVLALHMAYTNQRFLTNDQFSIVKPET